MRLFRFLIFIWCISPAAFCQGVRSTISAGAGGGFPAGGYRTDQFADGPAFSASYEFRLFRYFAADIEGVNLLPNYTEYSEYGSSVSRERVTLLSPGVRGILPLARGRVELFAGPGATHVWSSFYDLSHGYQTPRWLLEISGGGRFAIDRGRRFWIGPSMHWSRDGGRPTEEWVSLTVDVGYRF